MHVVKTVVTVGLGALVLVACGSATKTTQPGRVTVSFCTTVSMPGCATDATVAEERAVGRALRHSPHIVKVAYVAKAAALKSFGHPDLTGKLPAKPLPDEWVVTVDSEENNATVGKAVCAAHYAGIERCRVPGDLGGVHWDVLTQRIRQLR